MGLRVSRDVLGREESRVPVGTLEKRVNMEKLVWTASMEKRAKVEWLDPRERGDTLAEEDLKVPRDKQETLGTQASEETLVSLDRTTHRVD